LGACDIRTRNWQVTPSIYCLSDEHDAGYIWAGKLVIENETPSEVNESMAARPNAASVDVYNYVLRATLHTAPISAPPAGD
jgi:hypothetical protein